MPCERDVTPMTSTTPGSSVARSTSLPSVIVSDERRKRAAANVDASTRFYSGSLRHKDSIILRKSKLRQVHLRPPADRVSGESPNINNVAVQVIDAANDDSYCDHIDGRCNLSPRPDLDPNWGMSQVGQGHTRVIAPWTGGARLPEYAGHYSREPSSTQLLHRRQRGGNEATCKRNSTNKLTVVLSAVDLPYASCECHAALDLRCLPYTDWFRGVTTTQFVVQAHSRTDRKLGNYPTRTWSRNFEPVETKFHAEAEVTSSSPELVQHAKCCDRSLSSRGCQSSVAPATMTSQRRVYALARAYSDRVKQLQRRSTTTTRRADDFDVAADLRVPVHPVRARSVSVGRQTALSFLPAIYR